VSVIFFNRRFCATAVSYPFFLFSRLFRIHKYASCSSECFILALIYIDRLIQRNNFLLTHLNVHRVVISAVLVAAKFFDDAYYNNAYYAKVGGVLVSELNSLEVEFLFRINFGLHVSPELYEKYHAELLSHATGCDAMAEAATTLEAARANLIASTALHGRTVPAPFTAQSNLRSSQFVQNAAFSKVVLQQQQIDHRIIAPSHPYYGLDPSGARYHPQQTVYLQQNGMDDGSNSNLSRQLQHPNAPTYPPQHPQQQLRPAPQSSDMLCAVEYRGFPPRGESATVSLSDVDDNEQQYYIQQSHQAQMVQGPGGVVRSQAQPIYMSSITSTPCAEPHASAAIGMPQGHAVTDSTHGGMYEVVNAAPVKGSSSGAYMPQPSKCSPHQAHLSTHVVVTSTGGGVS
jgi:hypothetical protein